ncbi:MAG: sporulation protein YabP [Erysipelotrichaceae bacterium]
MKDDLLSNNPLRFESNPYHNVVLKDRKLLEITGVKQIDSFDANEFLMETDQGWMVVQGKDLTLDKLDSERGDVVIRGLIDGMSYVTNKKGGSRETLISKLFK